MCRSDNLKSFQAVVIDCGINAIKDPSHPKGQRLVGDVDYANVKQVSFMTITSDEWNLELCLSTLRVTVH